MSFGISNQPTPGFSFGAATPSAIVNPLGSSTTSIFAPQTGLVTSQPSLFGASSASAPNLFGATTGTSLFGGTNTTVSTGTTPSTGGLFASTRPVSFATTTSGTPSLFGAQSSTAFTLGGGQSAFPSFGLNAPIASTAGLLPAASATPVGLGGVDFSQISGTKSTTAGKNDSKTIKEQVVPNEIGESIDAFRKYVKEQKVIREEISRVSSKPICKVQEETASLKQLVSVLQSGLQRNALAIERLKIASAQDLKNAEMAQRTKDLPPSMQYENTAPTEYFQNLVVDFEKQMQSCRQQIEQLEQHFVSLAQPSILSPQELNLIVRRLHETFVALAAQLQSVHDSVRIQKDAFLSIRRSMIGDSTNIFERKNSDNRTSAKVAIPVTIGPAPFSSNPSAAAVAMASALNRAQQSGGLGTSGVFSGQQNQFPMYGNSSINPLGHFGSSSFSSPSTLGLGAVENKPFQLQKPPSGNKRGKRWTTN